MKACITIAVLTTLILASLAALWLNGRSRDDFSRRIESCIKAGNDPLPCVEAVLN